MKPGVLPRDGSPPELVRAAIGDVLVELSGGDFESTARVARALAALRFSARPAP